MQRVAEYPFYPYVYCLGWAGIAPDLAASFSAKISAASLYAGK
ncbi:MAG: hypothetical protein K0R55_2648, partial [Sporomusa sp.]|nr:hypothetical protein [Sporomusa sp.]